ncbi:PLP-dependent aminotransferase family protein [Paenactinomyces guangxiensis]|uniref:PLP-dependent aminotransferase family protein n=1 Tax=Paenactinomyces guangxiensis TaxID=1490290 RepID=A0A7W2A8Y5_9BACL|nr:PLP-dependent aminotransferase family protein [Paenactinomyces guangxiensis]MBA4496066.1 PLP-dependent aminotransferase family protein [Paenactinomyces guangxiensis]MBH8593154.1 PLP-dependent aminotransferase family protein [Paenactinomyces guangxiensis]
MNKYEIVKGYIKEQLHSGKIKPGGKLPSIREISIQFSCSKNTAIRAYHDLEKEHLIYSVPKSGYYAVLRASTMNLQPPGLIDFSSASPDPDVMPYEDFQHCLNRAIELYQDQLFSYSDPQGFFSLRKELSKHLAISQVFTRPEQICMVSGAQQALHLLTVMPFPNGKSTILVEQPAYYGMIRSIELLGVRAVGIRRTKEGIDLKELERHFRSNHIKFFYTVPRFHNPLGTSFSQEQKKQIARLAEKYDVYIVEDDYLADLEMDRKADPIYSYDPSGHTIYIKSFSKVMLPGLRLAAAVLPQSLIETFRMFKSSCDLSSTALSQAALEIFLNCGMFNRHTEYMRNRYHKRMEILRNACNQWLPSELSVHVPEGGIFSRMVLPDQLPAIDLAATLKQQNVLVVPTNRSFLKTFPKENGLRISIIHTNEAQIESGIRLIGEAAEQLLSRTTPETVSVIDWV